MNDILHVLYSMFSCSTVPTLPISESQDFFLKLHCRQTSTRDQNFNGIEGSVFSNGVICPSEVSMSVFIYYGYTWAPNRQKGSDVWEFSLLTVKNKTSLRGSDAG